MVKTPNQPTLKLASHGLCAVIAIEYKWAEEYLLYTHSIFHSVVETEPNDCCRHHNLREILRAKFYPFRNPCPQPWKFCGQRFCTNPVCWVSHLSTGSALDSQPGEHLHHHPLRAIMRFFSFNLTQLCLSHWHLWPHLLKYVLKTGTPVCTHLAHTWWVQQELLTDLPAPNTEPPLLFKSILKVQQHLPNKLSSSKENS